jgi:hypothetical protein
MHKPFRWVTAVLPLFAVSSPVDAIAQPDQAQADRASRESEEHPVRVGAIGGLGFPRPFAVEGMIKLGRVVSVGAEYGALPTMTIDGVQTSLTSIAGDARVFPFGGAFFLGVRAGHQHVAAQTSVSVAPYGSAVENLALDSWFVNPRVGFLWTWRAGFTLGVEAGLQIPLGFGTTSTLPLALDPSAQHTVNVLGKSWLPTLDLIRIGWLL